MNYDTIKADLIRHEALRLKPYLCSSDKITIGVGRNLDDRGITEEEAMILLDNDIKLCEQELTSSLPFWVDLSEDAQNIMLNLCFNMGISRLLKFKKMLCALEQGDMDEAATQLLDSRYASQVKGRATELADRLRKA